jgi:hypothetical protein
MTEQVTLTRIREISEVEKRIIDYIFIPTHTVSVDELKTGNMLISLYRVHKLSRLLEKGVSAEGI